MTDKIDDSVDFGLIGNNFQGRQYKKIFEKKYKKVCSTIFDESLKEFYEKIVENSDLPKFGECNFIPKKYHMSNLLLQESDLLPPYIVKYYYLKLCPVNKNL